MAYCRRARALARRSAPARRRLWRSITAARRGAGSRATRAHLLMHPTFEEGFCRLPLIEVGIKIAAEAFDVEQRLLQQHQLRLHFHVEAARGLEQPQQQLTEGDVLERPLEDGLAHGADG